jgi:apolipoprotein N-acyltransferase
VLTGFPWNLPGETWAAGGAPSQAAALVGAYGLTWITLAICAAPPAGRGPGRPRRGRAAAAATALYIWRLGAFGLHRLSEALGADRWFAFVQATYPQSAKWTPTASFRSIVERYVGQTARAGGMPPTSSSGPKAPCRRRPTTIWRPAPGCVPAIRDALKPGQTLLMGAYRAEGTGRRG